MKEIKELAESGKKLAEKKSWLEKGYSELLGTMNQQLKKIPEMDEGTIEYCIKTWTHTDDSGYVHVRTMTINLSFCPYACLELSLNKQDVFEGTWSRETLSNPQTTTIRLFAAELEDAFTFFVNEINKRNIDNQSAIETISGLLKKLEN